MHNDFKDIISAACGAIPLWWDQNGTPRFVKHHPRHCPDIYADTVVLMEIACQSCHREFEVQMSSGLFRNIRLQGPGKGMPNYGDPPNVGCCPSGATMTCDDLRILEWWDRNNKTRTWKRVRKNEGV